MNEHLKLIESKRENFLEITKNLTADQYNFVPDGFNNNIIWNMGHVLYVGENYLYKKSGFLAPVHPICLEKFKSGTKPEDLATEQEILYIRNSLMDSLHFLEHGGAGNPATEVTGQISTKTIEFVLFHDNYHYHTIENLMSAF